jgi:hypothetical protein
MASQCFPTNNLYKAVCENEISTQEICVRVNGLGPAPLIRTLSMPLVRTVNEIMSLIQSFYFVEHVSRHESGNIIVWAHICATREEEREYDHIGIIRFPNAPTTPLTTSRADEIILTGIYSNVFMVSRIVRADTHSTQDFSMERMYCAYILYLDESRAFPTDSTVEEGEVPDGAW